MCPALAHAETINRHVSEGQNNVDRVTVSVSSCQSQSFVCHHEETEGDSVVSGELSEFKKSTIIERCVDKNLT
ncbi:hypothetical protein V6N13_075795 [Hibiscus sabdariffa]